MQEPHNVDSGTVGIGMVGAGFLAETRARCYAQTAGVRVAAVVARSPESADRYAARHAVPNACRELDELLSLAEIDAVDLCVPNLLHRPMAELAAAAGKHVICTKPLAAYVGQDLDASARDEEVSARDRRDMLRVAVDDAEAMVAAGSCYGVRLMYGENWIYAPSIQRARDLLASSGGVILEMHGHEAHSGSHSPYSKLWRHAGGGALLRLGAHPIGAMLWLKRHEGVHPVGVTADVADLTKNPALTADNTSVETGWQDVENHATVIIEFADGSRGIARGSDNLLGGMESKLDVLASNCHVKCSMSPNDLVRAYAPDEEVLADEYLMEKSSSQAGWSTPIPSEDWCSGQLAMIQDFVAAIREGRGALSDGELGVEVTRVVYSAYVAAAEGRRVEL
ncbi:MAG: oxidoreductase [Planctomycetes bacterium]|nr:oxidoreductase [Planctomycetota bacterium]